MHGSAASRAGSSQGLPATTKTPSQARKRCPGPVTQAARQPQAGAARAAHGGFAAGAAVSGAARRRRSAAAGSLAPAPLPPARSWRTGRTLLHLALLSAACLAGALVGSRGRSRGAAPAALPSSGSVAASAPLAGSIHLAVVAPLQQPSPFGSFGQQASWREVLEHTAQRLAWTDPSFSLTLHDSAGLGDGASKAAAPALQTALQHSAAAVAIGVTDPADAAALAPLLAAAPTALAVGSHTALAGATRLGGRQPAQPAAGGLGALLERLFPDKQAKEDQQV